MAGCLAGLILFRGEFLGMLVSGISCLLTGIILCFVGWAILCPVIITLLWGLYRMITIQTIKRELEARQRNS
jgi:amino acid efflux transporter